jgi:hypothetical protein
MLTTTALLTAAVAALVWTAVLVGMLWLGHRDAIQVVDRMDRTVGRMDRAVDRMDHAVERMDQAVGRIDRATTACEHAAEACVSMAERVRDLVQHVIARERPGPTE